MAESATELDMLQLEFVSQMMDCSTRLLGVHDTVNEQERKTLDQYAKDIPNWVGRVCELQKKEQAVRARTPLPSPPDPSKSPKSSTKKSSVAKKPVFGVPLEELPLVPGFHVPLILFDTTEVLLGNPECLFPHSCTPSSVSLNLTAWTQQQSWRPRDCSASLPQKRNSMQSSLLSTMANLWALATASHTKSLAR